MFDRIESDPEVLGGKPCVKGTRLSVEFILELLAGGATPEQVAARYPQLTRDDVLQAVQYGARLAGSDRLLVDEMTI